LLLRPARSSQIGKYVRSAGLASQALDLDSGLIITKSCVNRIKQLQAQQDNPKLQLRVEVDSGGCSGFQYLFTMEHHDPEEAVDDDDDYYNDVDDDDDDGEQEDIIFSRDGAQVLVDPASLSYIRGSTIDYERELIRSAFAVVNNPQSESACGCGSSFAVKNFESNSVAH